MVSHIHIHSTIDNVHYHFKQVNTSILNCNINVLKSKVVQNHLKCVYTIHN